MWAPVWIDGKGGPIHPKQRLNFLGKETAYTQALKNSASIEDSSRKGDIGPRRCKSPPPGKKERQTVPGKAKMRLNRLKSAAADERLEFHRSAANLADTVSWSALQSGWFQPLSHTSRALSCKVPDCSLAYCGWSQPNQPLSGASTEKDPGGQYVRHYC